MGLATRCVPSGGLGMVAIPTGPASRSAICFYDTKGNPLAPTSAVKLTGDLEITDDGGLTVRTEMEPLGVLTISTHGQLSRTIDETFPAADTADFVGSVVRCGAVGTGRVTAMALETDPGTRIFITLPVVPVPERMSPK